MGIADSEGKIHDFQGPYTVIVDDFAFGRPTRYLGLNRLIGQILAIERGQSYWNGMGQCNPGRQSNLLQAHGTLFVLGSCVISALSMLGQLPFVCCFCAQSDAIRLRMAALERCYIGLGHAHPWALHWVCLISKMYDSSFMQIAWIHSNARSFPCARNPLHRLHNTLI
jgi:hypothetical protein